MEKLPQKDPKNNTILNKIKRVMGMGAIAAAGAITPQAQAQQAQDHITYGNDSQGYSTTGWDTPATDYGSWSTTSPNYGQYETTQQYNYGNEPPQLSSEKERITKKTTNDSGAAGAEGSLSWGATTANYGDTASGWDTPATDYGSWSTTSPNYGQDATSWGDASQVKYGHGYESSQILSEEEKAKMEADDSRVKLIENSLNVSLKDLLIAKDIGGIQLEYTHISPDKKNIYIKTPKGDTFITEVDVTTFENKYTLQEFLQKFISETLKNR